MLNAMFCSLFPHTSEQSPVEHILACCASFTGLKVGRFETSHCDVREDRENPPQTWLVS